LDGVLGFETKVPEPEGTEPEPVPSNQKLKNRNLSSRTMGTAQHPTGSLFLCVCVCVCFFGFLARSFQLPLSVDVFFMRLQQIL
jgi:hypothetical protein